MAGLMDDVMGALGGAGGGGLGDLVGGMLGGERKTNEKAAGLGIEAILGGIAQNASSRRGAKSLHRTLDRHDGSALDNAATEFGSNASTADGSKILGHVFGANQGAVERNIAEKSGLDLGSVAKLLPALAPMVMGMLGKKKQEGASVSGLSGMLGEAAGGLDLGNLAGLLGGGSGGGAGGVMGMLKGLLGRR